MPHRIRRENRAYHYVRAARKRVGRHSPGRFHPPVNPICIAGENNKPFAGSRHSWHLIDCPGGAGRSVGQSATALALFGNGSFHVAGSTPAGLVIHATRAHKPCQRHNSLLQRLTIPTYVIVFIFSTPWSRKLDHPRRPKVLYSMPVPVDVIGTPGLWRARACVTPLGTSYEPPRPHEASTMFSRRAAAACECTAPVAYRKGVD